MAAKRLFVEVCNARDLMPKDGEGSASPYCVLEYDGQRQKTEAKSKDLAPDWNTVIEFEVQTPMENNWIEIAVMSDKKTGGKQKPQFLGRVQIPARSAAKKGEEVTVYYPLAKRSFFSHVKGELGVKIWWTDEPDPPPAEAPAEPEGEKKPEEEAAEKKDEPAGEAAPAPPAEESKPAEEEEKPEEATPAEEEKKPEETKDEPEEPEAKEEAPAPKPEEAPKKPPKPTFVPAGEFVLKETKIATTTGIGERVVTFDLVEKMQYLFVRVMKARALAPKDPDATSNPYVKISLGSHTARTRTVAKTLFPEWNEVFAFGKERMGGPALEISVRDEDSDEFLGQVTFDLAEIPIRVPPDSPLAPQWYKLEKRFGDDHHGRVRGDVMVAVWLGTQADEAFTEAWQSDSGGYSHTRSKVYLSPKMWYLRVNVIEAQEVPVESHTEVNVRVQLGYQVQVTRNAINRSTSPFWNEDLLFVAAEPFEEELVLKVVERRGGKDETHLGLVRVPLASIERRADHRQVSSRWYNLDPHLEKEDDKKFLGRLHLRLCFDGGYHVMDEPVNYSSCTKPTAKHLWRNPVGVLELGVIRAKDVFPMKNREGRGATDAYVVAKYGNKWVRTRTVIDSLNPRWNEQYRWDVHDPCTVLTVGVFDNRQITPDSPGPDARIGKVRIRLSTLESNRVYTNRYPLLSLQESGVKKLGEIELAVRFSSVSILNTLHVYFQPMLPFMHYLHPLGVTQAEILRISAMRMVAMRLARSEPPLRQEVVQFMLDSEVNAWSLRRSKVNYFRLMNVLSGPFAVAGWLRSVSQWRNPVTTVLVHVLFLILVWYPELIFPTLFLYMFLIGLWKYRYRPRSPPSMEARLSQAESVEPDELDEEFDSIPSSRDPGVVRARYDRVRIVAARIQNVVGDLATQGERVAALLNWRDPRATGIFVVFSLVVAIVLYVVPFRVVVVVLGLYMLRHPRFRDPMPPLPLSFFRRLPSLADRIL